jgi:hypothetical protein
VRFVNGHFKGRGPLFDREGPHLETIEKTSPFSPGFEIAGRIAERYVGGIQNHTHLPQFLPLDSLNCGK